MTHVPVTTRTGGLNCLEATGRQKSQTDRSASWKAAGVNNLKKWLWNRLRAGWKLLALDGQDALLLYNGELGTSVFACARQRSTAMD